MTRDDIIAMAREAGFKASVGKTDKDGVYHPFINALGKDVPIEWLEHLFQAAYAAGAAAEREACSAIADRYHVPMMDTAADAIAAAIRARGNHASS